jgi:type IV pilus assembly protein PilB
MKIATEHINLISAVVALQYRIVPEKVTADIISLYCDEDRQQAQFVEELQVILNSDIELHALPKAEISKLLSTYYLTDSGVDKENALTAISAGDDFLTTLIEEARKLKSSDIHIEAFEKKARVRVRIDGMMIERCQVPKDDYPALVNKIKIMANLDIAEKRLPQDGRIHYQSAKHGAFDIRVSALPTLHGEKIVLRLLNTSSTEIDLYTLGIAAPDLEQYLQGIQRPNGIILISGPTGSGKTTTLYATLKLLNKSTRNILTIEDPIEYTLDGINQVQLRENIGLGFASALRTFLRQDPDVIMVGEIRDPETANMAIRAALTGHLVLSTIHTNSAWGTVSRLMDMGIPSFLVANTLNTTVAQRLVRLLCANCKEEVDLHESVYPKQFIAPYRLSRHCQPRGCDKCYFTGYSGRKAVYEIIQIDAALAQEIKAQNMDIGQQLKQKNINSLAQNAFALFADGQTSIEEIYPLLLAL